MFLVQLFGVRALPGGQICRKGVGSKLPGAEICRGVTTAGCPICRGVKTAGDENCRGSKLPGVKSGRGQNCQGRNLVVVKTAGGEIWRGSKLQYSGQKNNIVPPSTTILRENCSDVCLEKCNKKV